MAHGREEQILEHLFRSGNITIEEICERFGVSIATARRDLDRLEKLGRLRRTHGGAENVQALLYEPFRHVSIFQEQVEKHAAEKRRIALAAAEMVEDGDVIAISPGTTTMQFTRSLPSRKNLTLVTNTVNVAMELSSRADVSVFVTGGFMHAGWFSLAGPAALEAMRTISPDKAFLGANGAHAERGLTAFHPDEAGFNRVVAMQARKRIALVDHSKLGAIATYQFCAIENVDVVITDQMAKEADVRGFLERGIEVRRA